ncbi:MAG TPA: M23 family metallopeptidase [Thermoanaerobaculia bacterium]|nr:M23 family metallopeptidase [Thermoanaerobaculia bacterium]
MNFRPEQACWFLLAFISWLAGYGIALAAQSGASAEDLLAHQELLRQLTVRSLPGGGEGSAAPPGPLLHRGRADSLNLLDGLILQAPLRMFRVSSGFSRARVHPVTGETRPHYGVDLAAPLGMPVLVAADGVIVFIGREGAAGNLVKVRHRGGYLTAYLHLDRFAGGLLVGMWIGQGTVVGYVGQTGTATGPHLEYRVMRDGQWIDPCLVQRFKS